MQAINGSIPSHFTVKKKAGGGEVETEKKNNKILENLVSVV